MLYNKDTAKLQTTVDCLTCQHFNRKQKKCEGLGKTCFPYDPLTKTAIDPLTKLPIKLN